MLSRLSGHCEVRIPNWTAPNEPGETFQPNMHLRARIPWERKTKRFQFPKKLLGEAPLPLARLVAYR